MAETADGDGRADMTGTAEAARPRPPSARWFTRRGPLAAAICAALLAAGLGTAKATSTGPFAAEPRYCWGAWGHDTNPSLFGGSENQDRTWTVTEDELTAGQPHGSCTVVVESGYDDEVSRNRENVNTVRKTATRTLTVAVGPAPADPDDLVEWIAGTVGSDSAALPDGLPGLAHDTGGLLALPEECAADGRPVYAALTIGPLEGHAGTIRSGGLERVGRMLLEVGRQMMTELGCAPAEPWVITSPWSQLPEEEEPASDTADVCRIPGLRFVFGSAASHSGHRVGPVTQEFQSCSVRTGREPAGPALELMMLGQPWLTAAFAGTADAPSSRDWRGSGWVEESSAVVLTECGGRPVVLFMRGEPRAAVVGRDTIGSFAIFSQAVTHRVGCDPVAPTAEVES